ncbi:MAG: hypothetical protein AAFV29_21255, partial [Myxococcota bacterium]
NKMSMPVHGSHGPLDPANPTESSPAAPAFLAGDLAQFNVVKGAPVTVGSPVLNRDPAAPTAPVWGGSGVGSSAIPDEQQWKSDPAAPTEVFEMAHQDTAAGMPLVLTEQEVQSFEGPTPRAWNPNISVPPIRQRASLTTKLTTDGGIIAAVLVASLIGGVVGSQWSRRSDEKEQARATLIDRLGRARQQVNALRSRGIKLPDHVDDDIQLVRTQLLESDELNRVRVELQDLELVLDSLGTQ